MILDRANGMVRQGLRHASARLYATKPLTTGLSATFVAADAVV